MSNQPVKTELRPIVDRSSPKPSTPTIWSSAWGFWCQSPQRWQMPFQWLCWQLCCYGFWCTNNYALAGREREMVWKAFSGGGKN